MLLLTHMIQLSIWVIHKLGQIRLTRTKPDLDNLTRFPPWSANKKLNKSWGAYSRVALQP